MRLVALLPLALAACPLAADERVLVAPDEGGPGSVFAQCAEDDDCIPAAATCCECPTFAVPADDPGQRACNGVECEAHACPGNVRAACSAGQCVLACRAMACVRAEPGGYAADANGCLTCAPAPVPPAPAGACGGDGDCARTRADCCGCAEGGADTAVPASELGGFDASLGCSSAPLCPSVDTCVAGETAQCVQGACKLVGPLPAGACGRPDLPACPSGQACIVNVDERATAHGLGVCVPT